MLESGNKVLVRKSTKPRVEMGDRRCPSCGRGERARGLFAKREEEEEEEEQGGVSKERGESRAHEALGRSLGNDVACIWLGEEETEETEGRGR